MRLTRPPRRRSNAICQADALLCTCLTATLHKIADVTIISAIARQGKWETAGPIRGIKQCCYV